LVARPWAEIKAKARERLATPPPAGSSPSSWQPEISKRDYARRFVVWSGCVATLVLAGWTITLPRRDEREQAREFVTALRRNGLAGQTRFYDATDIARKGARTCDRTRLAAAESSAREILRLASGFAYDWNYGNAIHYGNLVLGRLALARGDVREAGRYLLRAGLTTGSPQLGDYGPDMTLARELLKEGDTSVVLRYFDLCNRFWKNENRNCIAAWSAAVRSSEMPDFGSRAGPVPIPERGWTCNLLEETDAK
jgi:hypothetical protein